MQLKCFISLAEDQRGYRTMVSELLPQPRTNKFYWGIIIREQKKRCTWVKLNLKRPVKLSPSIQPYCETTTRNVKRKRRRKINTYPPYQNLNKKKDKTKLSKINAFT